MAATIDATFRCQYFTNLFNRMYGMPMRALYFTLFYSVYTPDIRSKIDREAEKGTTFLLGINLPMRNII